MNKVKTIVNSSAILSMLICNLGLLIALFALMTLIGIPLGLVIGWVSVKYGIKSVKLLRS